MHKIYRIIVTVLWLWLGSVNTAPALEQLPAPVAAVLADRRLPPSGLSVFIQPLDGGRPLLAFNADRLRQPASTIKVLTTYAALEMLGPTYSWKTAAYLDGTLQAGRLRGRLVLKGYGDPFLTPEKLWTFAAGLRHQGLQDIDGGLAIDNSYFTLPQADPGDFDGRPRRAYNALPTALMVNFQALGLRFRPQPAAGRVAVVVDPLPANLSVANRLRFTPGQCRRRQLKLDLTPQPDGALLAVSGRYPSGCGETDMHRLLLPPEQLAYGVFRTLWQQLGGRLSGGLSAAVVSGPRRPFYARRSQPLAELIRGMNKYSNNVMTRQLFLTLGAERFGPPGSLDKSRRALNEWLAGKGLVLPGLFVDNGAGLSRRTRVTARGLGQVLLAAAVSPYAPELQTSLPLAALDGTLRRRFIGEPLAGRLRLKTGSIDDVRGIAGYLRSATERRYAVVMLHNQPGLAQSAAVQAQNALLRWLYSQ